MHELTRITVPEWLYPRNSDNVYETRDFISEANERWRKMYEYRHKQRVEARKKRTRCIDFWDQYDVGKTWDEVNEYILKTAHDAQESYPWLETYETTIYRTILAQKFVEPLRIYKVTLKPEIKIEWRNINGKNVGTP